MQVTNHPKPWIAVVLGFFVPPLGLLYVGKPRLAITFFAILLSLGAADLFHSFGNGFEWVQSVLALLISTAGAVFAYKGAIKARRGATPPWYARWYYLMSFGSMAMLAVTACRIFLYEPFRIPSMAMAPVLEPGSRIIVQKVGFGHFSTYGFTFGSRPPTAQLKRGDIIVFDYPRDPAQAYIKRIVGLPGDRIDYRGKRLFVNARDSRVREVDEYLDSSSLHYLQRFREKLDDTEFDTLLDSDRPAGNLEWLGDQCSFSNDALHCVVPAGNYFVLGDNRDNSADSRHWGFVRSNLIIGKVVKIIP